MTEAEEKLSGLLSERGRLQVEILKAQNRMAAARRQLSGVLRDINATVARLGRNSVVYGGPEETRGIYGVKGY